MSISNKNSGSYVKNNNRVSGAYKLFFGTLVSEDRLRILNLLREKARYVSDIMKDLNMEQTVASHHLARLKKCGFVHVTKKGKYRQYAINKKTMLPLLDMIDKHMSEYCVHILRKKR